MDENNIDINNVEIDKLQQAIENMTVDEEKIGNAQEPLKDPLEVMSNMQQQPQKENSADKPATSDKQEDTNEYKKYVLKINKKYQRLIDNMTIEEREQYINAMLEFYIANDNKVEKKLKIKDSVLHILTAVITCIIGVPLILFIMNKTIETTVANYKQTQTNFINLYQDKGGLKKKDLSKLRDLK